MPRKAKVELSTAIHAICKFPQDFKEGKLSDYKGFSNRDITISYLYMNAPLNFFNELSMSKR